MKIIVFPDANGIVSNAGRIIGTEVPPGARFANVESLDLAPHKVARLLVNGAIEILDNWVGSGPWFDQNAAPADRLKAIQITEYGIVPLSTWAMEPRAETAEEVAAKAEADRIAAEAAAAAAAAEEARVERERIASIVVSDRQFAQACAMAGLITPPEALAWVRTGDLPAALAAALEGLSLVEKFAFEMILSGATSFERSSPRTAALGEALGKTPAEIDGLFLLAASL